MADIGNDIDAIRAAKVGEQVREEIADALEKMNEQAAAAQEWATGEDDPTAEPGEENNAKYYADQAAASLAAIPQDYSTISRNVASLNIDTVENFMDSYAIADYTYKGVTYTQRQNGAIYASGTSTGTNSIMNFYASFDTLPAWAVLGRSYQVDYAGTNVRFMIYVTRGENLANVVSTYTSTDFTIPDDNTITGMIIRLRVDASGATVNETVRPIIRDKKTNAELTAAVDDLQGDTEDIAAEMTLKASAADVYKYNSIDVMEKEYGSMANSTRNGITYTKNNNGGWNVSGTATGSSFGNLINKTSNLPAYIVPGRTYYLDMHGGTVPIRIYI